VFGGALNSNYRNSNVFLPAVKCHLSPSFTRRLLVGMGEMTLVGYEGVGTGGKLPLSTHVEKPCF